MVLPKVLLLTVSFDILLFICFGQPLELDAAAILDSTEIITNRLDGCIVVVSSDEIMTILS